MTERYRFRAGYPNGRRPAIGGSRDVRAAGTANVTWQAAPILFYWPRPMTKFPAILLALIVCAATFLPKASAQQEGTKPEEDIVVKALSDILPGSVEGRVIYDQGAGTFAATNGIYVN